NQNARQYDGDVLEPFSRMLDDPAPRKLIVVHLLGTHMSYRFRYPPEFERFTDAEGAPGHVTADQLPTYNSYDNAVLYNDFVVSGLIERVAAGEPISFQLHRAGHGDEVFDAQKADVLGRKEGRPTSPRYTVPSTRW